jgi:hypothetical protein
MVIESVFLVGGAKNKRPFRPHVTRCSSFTGAVGADFNRGNDGVAVPDSVNGL